MKVLLILIVLLGLAYYFFLYKQPPKPHPALATPSPVPTETEAPAATPPRGFDALIAVLSQDMNAIPVPIDGPGHSPVNALAIKRRIRPFLGAHVEYQILAEACDLIIFADSQRTTFQEAFHSESARAAFNNPLLTDTGISPRRGPKQPKATPTPSVEDTQAAIHQRVQDNWTSSRAQTSAKVQQLLAPLAGRTL